jgi:hypothetical protein
MVPSGGKSRPQPSPNYGGGSSSSGGRSGSTTYKSSQVAIGIQIGGDPLARSTRGLQYQRPYYSNPQRGYVSGEYVYPGFYEDGRGNFEQGYQAALEAVRRGEAGAEQRLQRLILEQIEANNRNKDLSPEERERTNRQLMDLLKGSKQTSTNSIKGRFFWSSCEPDVFEPVNPEKKGSELEK